MDLWAEQNQGRVLAEEQLTKSRTAHFPYYGECVQLLVVRDFEFVIDCAWNRISSVLD